MLTADFLQYLKAERNYSANTIIAYTRDLQSFSEFVHDQYDLNLDLTDDVAQVHHRMIRAWMGSLHEADLGNRSLARKVASVSAFFRFLHKRSVIESNPAKNVKVPKFEKKLPSFLREESIDKLFERLEYPAGYEGARDRCILEIFYSAGIRRAELVSLQYQAIDFRNRTMRVMGKGRKERIVPFGEAAAQSMRVYMQACEDQSLNYRGFFFVKKDNEPLYPELVNRIVGKYLKLASTLSKTSPHVLRHTFATHLLNNGADLNAIKEMLGHTSLAATQVYVHNSISKLKEVYSKAHPKA